MSVPGLAQIFMQLFLNLIYVDLLMTDRWLLPFFYKKGEVDDDTQVMNEYFSENGFESMTLVKNLGSTFLYLLVYLSLIFAYLVLKVLAWKSMTLKILAEKVSGWLFWNASIKFMISQFPPLFIAAFINLNAIKFETTI